MILLSQDTAFRRDDLRTVKIDFKACYQFNETQELQGVVDVVTFGKLSAAECDINQTIYI